MPTVLVSFWWFTHLSFVVSGLQVLRQGWRFPYFICCC